MKCDPNNIFFYVYIGEFKRPSGLSAQFRTYLTVLLCNRCILTKHCILILHRAAARDTQEWDDHRAKYYLFTEETTS